jgi:hypothetical protein
MLKNKCNDILKRKILKINMQKKKRSWNFFGWRIHRVIIAYESYLFVESRG